MPAPPIYRPGEDIDGPLADKSAVATINRALRAYLRRSRYPGYFVKGHHRGPTMTWGHMLDKSAFYYAPMEICRGESQPDVL